MTLCVFAREDRKQGRWGKCHSLSAFTGLYLRVALSSRLLKSIRACAPISREPLSTFLRRWSIVKIGKSSCYTKVPSPLLSNAWPGGPAGHGAEEPRE